MIPDTYASVHQMNELTPPQTISFPSRWVLGKNIDDAKRDIIKLAGVINRGTEALASCYMRICDHIRTFALTDLEVRELLSPYFPHPRISEILRVSRARDEIYSRYTGGFFGFKAALKECRGYRIGESDYLRKRKIARTAERLVQLGARGDICVRGRVVSVH